MRAYELEESAVEELKDRLPKLKRHDYDTIDNLMQHVCTRHKITGKKLHDMFVRKYGHTPDTWIKKYKNKLGEEGVAEGFQPVVPVKSRSQGSVSPEQQKDIDRDVKLLNKYRSKGMSAGSAADRLAKFKHKHMEEQGVAEDRLDELSPKTLGSYINKATKDAGTLGYGLGDINARPGKYKDSPDVVKDVKHSFNNRIKGVEKASHRLTKEQGVAEGHADQQRRVFKKNGEPVGEVGIDRESSPGNGQWYMKYYPTGDDFGGYDSMEEAVADLKHLVNQFKAEGVAESDDKYAELSKKIRDLAQAGKEGEANKLRYELNRLLMLDRDKKRRQERGVAEGTEEYCDACDRVITKKPHVCPGSQGVAEGIETVYGKKYDVDPNKYYIWAWDGAVVLYGEYDNVEDAKINLPNLEKKAIERLGPYVKDAFELSTGKDLLHRYGKKGVSEEWSQKYKSSINCSHPKGFSQKAHCAGKKKSNEGEEVSEITKKSAVKQYTDVQNYKPNFKTKPKSDTEEFFRITVDNPNKKVNKVNEGVEGPQDIEKIKHFIKWSYKTLNMQKPYPKITLSKNTEIAQAGHHTGVHKGNEIWVYVGNRNMIDIFRTIFHELTHHRQMQLGMIKDGDSYPGSPIEMLADMAAGKYLKVYGKMHPEMFQ